MHDARRFGAANLGGLVRVASVLLVLLAMASFVAIRSAAAQDNSLTIDLKELNNSGISGTATLTDNGDGTTHVSIKVTGATGGHPAHIHEGTCDSLDPNPLYPLTDVNADGVSETDVPVSLDDLLAAPYAVNLHESATNLGVYVACGNIVRATGGETTSTTAEATPTPAPTSTPTSSGTGGQTTTPSTGVGVLADGGSTAGLQGILAAIGGTVAAAGAYMRRRK
jgi:hypothetical protein